MNVRNNSYFVRPFCSNSPVNLPNNSPIHSPLHSPVHSPTHFLAQTISPKLQNQLNNSTDSELAPISIEIGDMIQVEMDGFFKFYEISSIYSSDRILARANLIDSPIYVILVGSYWKVEGLSLFHIVHFLKIDPVVFRIYIGKGILYSDQLSRLIQNIASKFNCQIQIVDKWDHANFIWKPTTNGLDYSNLRDLQFLNNFRTTHLTLTQKRALAQTGQKIYGPQFFWWSPYSVELTVDSLLIYPPNLYHDGLGTSAWILKPDNSFGGKGVCVFWSLTELYQYIQTNSRQSESLFFVQKFIEHPLLLNGYKFDVRVHVLMTATEILVHDFIHLTLAPRPFQSRSIDSRINLTNFNLHHRHDKILGLSSLEKLGIYHRNILDFVYKLKPLFEYARVFEEHNPAHFSRFELFGIDLTFDETKKPWLLEINKNPGIDRNGGGALFVENSDRLIQDTLLEGVFFQLFPTRRTKTGFRSI